MRQKKASKSQRRATTNKSTKGTGAAKGSRKAAVSRTAKSYKVLGVEREAGPRGWLYPILESAYTKLVTPEQAKTEAAKKPSGKPTAYRSTLQPGKGEAVMGKAPQSFWLDRIAEYKSRKAGRVATPTAFAPMPTGPVVPTQKNWAPLGPSVVIHGQAQGLPSVGGRIAGIAVAPGGQIVYGASANGGVFRSDDGGMSWRSLMDAFDVDPTNFASTSLACGAIAIDRNDPNRVYVGTGEGNTNGMFAERIVNALPAYRGIGPIRSDDGGQTWTLEPTATGSPDLAGKAFFALAVDPTNRENVFGATSEGLYQRVPKAGGGMQWIRRRPGVHSSVVAAASGTTKVFAAEWGKGVFQSTNGTTWTALGTGLPVTNVGRIELGVQVNNPGVLYAAIANKRGALLGVFRLNGAAGAWKRVANAPDVLPVDESGGSQGDYDLAIAVDPADANLIYLGGSYFADQQFWPASVWRCRVQTSGAAFSMTGASIGTRAHADVHVLTHTPADPNSLWVGCDGGIFINRDPKGTGAFASRNDGLACLCPNFFAQHPTDPNILFCGLQDNGTARTGGGAIWRHVNWGDGGYCVINWANPQQVLVFANGTVYKATDGGQDHDSWSATDFPWSLMTEPIVTTPYNPTHPVDAKTVALGSGQMVNNSLRRVIYISNDFGTTWPTIVPVPTVAGIFAMRFASPTRLFIGTTAGEVFRLDRTGTIWNITRLDNVAAGPIGLHGLITDVAVDWADPSMASIYASFGGTGDNRRVWHFDGTRWEARSGTAGTSHLLDVEHNAVTVDRTAPQNVYVGADIGVWHSSDGGHNWQPLPNGLPDASVFDLQIHPTQRLLRASTHGRGLYEYQL